MKYTGFIFISALALATASCSSDSVDGDGDLFRRGAFEQTVDGTRMVFVASQENDNDVMFTWDRINQNYISNDITSANKYSGDMRKAHGHNSKRGSGILGSQPAGAFHQHHEAYPPFNDKEHERSAVCLLRKVRQAEDRATATCRSHC